MLNWILSGVSQKKTAKIVFKINNVTPLVCISNLDIRL